MNWRQPISLLLVALCTILFLSTVWIYRTSVQANIELNKVTKSAIGRVFISQVNLMRISDILENCRPQTDCVNDDLGPRTRKLAVGLATLVDSLAPANRTHVYTTLVGKLVAKYDIASASGHDFSVAVEPGLRRTDMAQLQSEAAPLGQVLQSNLLQQLQDLSNSLWDEPPNILEKVSIAFLLLVLSGAGLTILLGVELRQRGKLLKQIRIMHDAESEWQRGTVLFLQSLPVPVLLMNADGLAYANQSAQTLATSPGQLDSLNTLAQMLYEQLEPSETAGPASRDFTYFHGDGSLRQLSASISEIWLTSGKHRVYVILDNTLLRDAELRAMTSGKLAVLGELSSAVAHELNQPLAVIKAAAANGKLLAGHLEGSKSVVEKFDRIDHQIERARRIIGNVRKLGHPRQRAETPFHAGRSLSSTFGLVSEQYRLSGVTLEIDVELNDAVSVIGDYTLFEIAVLNILLNAKDAFDLGPGAAGPATVRVTSRFSDGELLVEVLDNAGGISPALLPHIFKSFVSSKSADKGTGLGLSIARRAIEDMHGRIAAENVEGGALFTIVLPAFVKEAST
jgi:signal transduction histidine kinase